MIAAEVLILVRRASKIESETLGMLTYQHKRKRKTS